jgi:pyruvate carboxylase
MTDILEIPGGQISLKSVLSQQRRYVGLDGRTDGRTDEYDSANMRFLRLQQRT